MKVLGIGGGSRELAIAKAIARSSYNPKIYWISELRNPGIYKLVKKSGGEYFLGSTNDAKLVADQAEKRKVDLAVVGPEEPNFHGVPDEVETRGIPCIGAKKSLSVVEMSKAEMRRLQWLYDIPGKLLFQTHRSYSDALENLKRYSNTLTWLQNVALKPARQAGGKGVKVVEDIQAYLHPEKQSFKERHIMWLENYMEAYRDIEEKILDALEHGESVKAIAEDLGFSSPKVVYTYLHRIRKKIIKAQTFLNKIENHRKRLRLVRREKFLITY